MSVALLNHSLSHVATEDLNLLSKALEKVAREYYRQSCEAMKEDARTGRNPAQRYSTDRFSSGPTFLRQFWESGESERFELSEPDGDWLNYVVRNGSEVWIYSKELSGIRMGEISRQIRQSRAQVDSLQQRDLSKGYTSTLIFLSAVVWVLALGSILFLANRISRPIQDLTAGLHQLAGGNFSARLSSSQRDEVGRAVQAFNHTAEHLRQNRERLVYLTQIASWQRLARKMAHELKNSLTPIRLTVEEIVARSPQNEQPFLEQAAQVVISEVESLERRVRAFSNFATEPPMKAGELDLNALLAERVRFLEVAHPDIHYEIVPEDLVPLAWADADQVKGIITNLLENAAEAAGPKGIVRATTGICDDRPALEIHDSGPGLSEDARGSLFEPTISFKQNGMGLGLSISRKNALLAGGDLLAITGLLGGAGFRLVLPAVNAAGGSGEGKKHDC